jgi:hypothetical protein
MCENATLKILVKVPGSWEVKSAREQSSQNCKGSNARKSEAKENGTDLFERRKAMAIN